MAKKGIIKSAAILTASGIINRILGFVYRIYMSNVIGAEGMGLYQLIMPIYSLAWSISCSGFTTTLSKLISAEQAKGEYGNMGRILKQSLVITSGLGLLLSVLLFFNAEFAAANFVKDERLILSLKILSLSFPFMAAGSCIRGYFYGLQETTVPAVSQVFEQLVRMAAIFALSHKLIPMGLEFACAAAVIGIFLGEFFSFLMIIFSYKYFKAKNSFNKKPSYTTFDSFILIFSMSLPLTLNRVSGSLLLSIENMMLPQRLQLSGLTGSQAMEEFGKISGMAMPLIMFPSAILVSLAISLVPAISEALAVNNMKRINFTVSKVLLFTNIIGICAAGFFILYSGNLGSIIYNEDIAEILIYLGIMCPFTYMNTTFSGILNGFGEQVFIFKNSLLSSAISIFFVWTSVPIIGIKGYILGSFVALCVVCSLSIFKIRKVSHMSIDFGNWFLKPSLAITAACLTVNLFKDLLFFYLGDVLGLLAGTLILGLIYIIAVVSIGTISRNDMKILFKR
ncbi:putative polysaccharide biosynthesis protein [Anaeropeptidivorans aminofermentans]|uniref:putative polysaccharide biosynthesis protein n=1 Tax=Anaeropeptidivorans aminofermentans TaxID=2934315 RepID=UPI002023EB3F|nr:polysaccharide biosynthesis protein [Anaeropeptidivorans aminofermentans]